MPSAKPHLRLESDDRFGPTGRKIAARSRENLIAHQTDQQSEVEADFESDPSIDLHSIIRNPDGSGGESLHILLDKEGGNRIILLLNGIVNPQDIVQVSPVLTRLGMAGYKLMAHFRGRYGTTLNDLINGESIPKYISNTIRKIQEELFDGKDCEVIVVRNASKEDLHASVTLGGENAAVVVGGHGTINSVSMTDGEVRNEEINTPDKPLKAFIQHACAGESDKTGEEMGDRIANSVYGWRRGTNPVDFIKDPLHKRS